MKFSAKLTSSLPICHQLPSCSMTSEQEPQIVPVQARRQSNESAPARTMQAGSRESRKTESKVIAT
jgi:hypothetical protein